MKSSRLTVKGQITVPKKLRDAFGWAARTELEFKKLPDGVKLSRRAKEKSRGWSLVERLRASGNRKLSTDEIMSRTRGEEL